ncbi:AI-2E family transporter [Candidatus Saccharibacteria bacterium]|nr:AI-2E family transporter [Candidatus Saccharibacteria bacterium]NCU44001.1 AI-2E family transporter [Candidatus Saccharibacteria bacterium]
MKVKIDIDTKTFIRFWIVVIGFLLLGLVIWRAKDALILIFISLFFALALNHPVSKITQALPGSKENRVGATAVAYFLIVALLGLFISFVVPTLVEQTSKFVDNLPSLVEGFSGQYSGLENFADKYNLTSYVEQVAVSLRDSFADLSKNIGGMVFNGVNAIARAIFSVFMVLAMAFLMLIEGPDWLRRLWQSYEDKEKMKKHRRIANRMYKSVSAYVSGQLLIALISGIGGATMVGILSLFFAVPSSLAISVGVIVAVIGLVPMFGATIAGIIAALIIGFNVPFAGIVFGIYFIIYQQIENNIISPMIQAKTNQLSALLVIVAITIGIYAFGILGALISIPAAACAKILFEEYISKSRPKAQPKKDLKDNWIAKLIKNIPE